MKFYAVILLLACMSFGQMPYTAVNALQSNGLQESEAATLSEVLRSKLIQTKKFRIMERSEMESILKEQAFQQTGACTDDACIVEMGQLLGIELMVAGSIGKVGKAYNISVRLIDIATGEIKADVSHTYTGPIENLLTEEITVVASKLAGVELPKSRTSRGTRSLRPLVIGGTIGVVVAGGVVALILALRKDEPAPPPPPAP